MRCWATTACAVTSAPEFDAHLEKVQMLRRPDVDAFLKRTGLKDTLENRRKAAERCWPIWRRPSPSCRWFSAPGHHPQLAAREPADPVRRHRPERCGPDREVHPAGPDAT